MILLLSFVFASFADLDIPRAAEYVHLRVEAQTARDLPPSSPRERAVAPGEVSFDLYFKPGDRTAPPIVRARYEVPLERGGSEFIDSGFRPARYQTTQAYEETQRKSLATVAKYQEVSAYVEPAFTEIGLAVSVTNSSAKPGTGFKAALEHIFSPKRFEVNELTIVLPILMYSGHITDVNPTEFKIVHVFEEKARAFQLRRHFTAIARRRQMTSSEKFELQRIVEMLCGPELDGRPAN